MPAHSANAGHEAKRRPWLVLLRYILALLPFVWIFSRVDLARFGQAFQHVAWWTAPAVSCTILISFYLQGYRWWLLMRAVAPTISLSQATSAHFQGLFYSIVLPTSAAQDIVRAALLSRSEASSTVWGATWLCKLLGLAVMAVMLLCGLLAIDRTAIPRSVEVSLMSAFAALALLVLLSFSKRFTKGIRLVVQHRVPAKAMEWLLGVREVVYRYRDHRRGVLQALVVTVTVQAFGIAGASIILAGVVGRPHAAECLFFVPATEFVAVSIPLTPNGMGLREAMYAVFFRYLGLSTEQLGVFVVIALLAVLLRLVGGVFVVADRFAHARANPRSP
jgi:glycosyltransferase 2 family protein